MAESFSKKFTPAQDGVTKLLSSTSQSDVAMGLAHLLAESQPDLQGQIVSLGHIVWQKYNLEKDDKFDKAEKKKHDAAAAVKALFETVEDPQQKLKLTEAYARLGHLYEIGGHVARANFFRERDAVCGAENEKMKGQHPTAKTLERDQVVPGGLNEMLFVETKDGKPNSFATMEVGDVVQKLSTPVSEYVFTQHPTNTNQLDSMKLQRQISQDAENLVEGIENLQTLKEHIKEFGEKPLVSAGNFTAKDETGICLNFLENAYHDLDRLYAVTDRALERKFEGAYDDEKRAALDLKVRFDSWGSAGDKDGNANIKSENTLEAIVMHKQRAAELLLESLQGAGELPEALKGWESKLATAAGDYKALFEKIEAVRPDKTKSDIPLSKAQFAQFSENAQTTSKMVLGKAEDFQKDLKVAIEQATGEQKTKLLAIDRKVRVFGFNLGKIEYRETADEYARVVNAFMKTEEAKRAFGQDKHGRNKAEMFVESNDQGYRAEILREILSDDAKKRVWIKIAQKFMEMHDGSDAAMRDISNKENPDAIIYHSLRRMELARDFGEMLTHNVLAEAQGVGSLMEALALQYAVTDREGKRAKLHIVPLFEDAETMAEIPNVIQDGLANKVYHDHLKTMRVEDRKTNSEATLAQQIQIAHSDNARRAGAIGSRGIIHEGHAAARLAIQEYNEGKPEAEQVKLQLFEGGSLSDSYRNGVRAHTAMMEDFGLDDFSKFTFQGGDLLNYFNQPKSMERVLLRGIVKQVELLENKKTSGVEGIASDLDPVEKAVRATLKQLQHGYDEFYDKEQNSANPIGRLLHALGYRALEKAGNAGTRANRNAKTPAGEAISGIDSGKLRTIAFSMGFQHNDLHPACLGIEQVATRLAECMRAKEDDEKGNDKSKAEIVFTARFEEFKQRNAAYFDTLDEAEKRNFIKLAPDAKAFTDAGQLTPEALHYLYKEGSKAFKDAVDKMAYSLYNTDIKLVQRTLEEYKQKNGKDPEIGKTFSDLDVAFGKVVQYYIHAADIVHKSLSGKEYAWYRENNQPDKLARAIYDIKKLGAMEHLEPLSYKQRFVEGARAVASAVQSSIEGLVEGGKDYVDRLFYNARATLYHGRTFMADDPAYRAAHMDAKLDQSPVTGMSP